MLKKYGYSLIVVGLIILIGEIPPIIPLDLPYEV